MSKAFTLDTNGPSFGQGGFGAKAVTNTVMAYIDFAEGALDMAGSPHPFRTATNVSLQIPEDAIVTNVLSRR